MPEAFFSTAGMLGVIFYLAAYFLLQAGLIKGAGYLYALMNLIGASLVLISLYLDFNLSSAIIQVSFITLSIFGMARFYILNNAIRFSEQEQALIQKKFPTASKIALRRFFAAGTWTDGTRSDVIIEEDTQVSGLFYLAEGEAEVLSEGVPVALVPTGGFLGEMSVLHDIPASATVRLSDASRLFFISRAALQRQVEKDAEFRFHLENALSADTRSKLITANSKLRSATLSDDPGDRSDTKVAD